MGAFLPLNLGLFRDSKLVVSLLFCILLFSYCDFDFSSEPVRTNWRYHLGWEIAQNRLDQFGQREGRTYRAGTQHFSHFDNHTFHVRCDAECVLEQLSHHVLRMELERVAGDTSGNM